MHAILAWQKSYTIIVTISRQFSIIVADLVIIIILTYVSCVVESGYFKPETMLAFWKVMVQKNNNKKITPITLN